MNWRCIFLGHRVFVSPWVAHAAYGWVRTVECNRCAALLLVQTSNSHSKPLDDVAP